MSTDNPVALVTGGAHRIGAEICRTLHRIDYKLALHYHKSMDRAEELARELNAHRPDSCHIYGGDLCDEVAVELLSSAVLADFGGLDMLVNNASLYFRTPPDESNAKDWEQLTASNLRAPFLIVRYLQQALKERGGSVVNILDAHSHRAAPGYAVYDMTRSGLESLTRSLARELAPGVRVNGVAPGMILWPETRDASLSNEQKEALLELIPLGRLGSPEDIASAVRFLASAPYITGQVLVVDGGRSLA